MAASRAARPASAGVSREGQLPVFATPSSVTFYTDDPVTHKQVITLYNPYEFKLRFKVLCTAPRKYNIVDAEGSVKAKCCIDILIRHKDVSSFNEGIRDKLRIQTYEVGLKTIAGKRDVPLLLLPTKERRDQEDEFETMPVSAAAMQRGGAGGTGGSEVGWGAGAGGGRNFQPQRAVGTSKIVIVAAILAIIALLLPSPIDLEDAEKSSLPECLHISHSQKLIAAYVLGMVSIIIIQNH